MVTQARPFLFKKAVIRDFHQRVSGAAKFYHLGLMCGSYLSHFMGPKVNMRAQSERWQKGR